MYGYELLLTELHMGGHLEALDAVTLAVLMTSVVYEPRPRMLPPKRQGISKRLAALCQEPLARIHQEEARFNIHPRTKVPAFHLAAAMEAWMHLTPFAKIARLCEVDEGEIVRYFRMAIQLLRQLREAPGVAPHVAAHAGRALERINRDVVDAEAQLRMG